MTRLISAELFKLRKRLMTRVLLFVLVGIMIVLYLLLLAVSKVTIPVHGSEEIGAIQNLLGLPLALPFALSILSSLGTILAVILIASSVGTEYSWRTMRTMLICSESRLKLLGAKLVAAGILILIGMVIGLATGFLMSLITTAIGGYSFDFSFMTGGYLWDQFLQFWRTFYVLMPYALLGFLLAVVGRSAMPGIALGIGIFFLESIVTTFMSLAGGWIARIPDYLLAANVRAITARSNLPQGMSMGMGGNGLFDQMPELWLAFVILAGYSLVFIGLAFYLFRKRDVTG
ncbi:MAG: ABC transporter permease subunit [Dehalococcoidales bacterium]|nr:ABC transporter permease subunit [Dehalococcoidales bacterium]